MSVDLSQHLIDEQALKALLDEVLAGPHDERVSGLLAEIAAVTKGVAAVKLASLKGLLARKRIPDLSEHRYHILCDVDGIRGAASIHNHKVAEHEKRLRVFRVEFSPIYNLPEVGDLRMNAAIYIDNAWVRNVRCIVSSEYIDSRPIGSRSLSKVRARRRRLEENLHFFELTFERHLNDLFDQGSDMHSVQEMKLPGIPM